jgi:uncharacterized membrane protein YdjX (TVP38/TMEM64 family)
MRRPLSILLGLTALAVAVPLVTFLAFGARLDHAVANWLDPPPPPAVLAVAEVGILAVDILLPVPSSLVATLGGSQLGIAMGTACGWLGMTLGAMAGWGLGRVVGLASLARLDDEARGSLAAHEQRMGPVLVVITRPLPLIAEAAAIMAGAAAMPFGSFLAAAASGNVAIALAWSVAGALGRQGDGLQWVLVWSLIVPVILTWLWVRGRMKPPPQQLPPISQSA